MQYNVEVRLLRCNEVDKRTKFSSELESRQWRQVTESWKESGLTCGLVYRLHKQEHGRLRNRVQQQDGRASAKAGTGSAKEAEFGCVLEGRQRRQECRRRRNQIWLQAGDSSANKVCKVTRFSFQKQELDSSSVEGRDCCRDRNWLQVRTKFTADRFSSEPNTRRFRQDLNCEWTVLLQARHVGTEPWAGTVSC